MKKELIQQQIEIKDWPLSKVGDKKFFGYVVAMGTFPKDWGTEDGMIPYVDFAYNDMYERYRLPDDKKLKKQLHQFLWHNLNGVAHDGDIYGKVWVVLTYKGYVVEMP